MLSDYTFLTDHSYSLRPVIDDNDELSLNQRQEKTNKRRRSSNRTNTITSTTNRTVSIDRSSSDKENNSLILSNSNNLPISIINSSINTNQSSTNTRSNKKKPIVSRRSRLSTRTVMNNSRKQSGKKQNTKTGIKLTQGNSIRKKKKIINRNKTKSLNIFQIDYNDAPPSLSIEERVKLRRTKPLQPSPIIIEKKSTKINKSQTKKKDKIIQSKITSPIISTNKTNKSFLGSGLDLDNIVLGNRQRRCVQT